MSATTNTGFSARPGHSQGLLLIGVLKLLKSAFFIAVGVGALHLLHKDLADLFMRVAVSLRFDPEGHVVGTLLDKVALLNDHRLRQISVATFCYATVAMVEGVGLMLERVWAEYLTTILTALFLPFEVVEIVRRATWTKGLLIAINLAVLIYLVQYIRKGRLQKMQQQQPTITAMPSPSIR